MGAIMLERRSSSYFSIRALISSPFSHSQAKKMARMCSPSVLKCLFSAEAVSPGRSGSVRMYIEPVGLMTALIFVCVECRKIFASHRRDSGKEADGKFFWIPNCKSGNLQYKPCFLTGASGTHSCRHNRQRKRA